MAFIFRMLVNARREHEIKENNQKYYQLKIDEFYGKTGRERQGEGTKEAGSGETTETRKTG